MDNKEAGSIVFYKCECVPSKLNLLIEDQQSGEGKKTKAPSFWDNLCSSKVPMLVFQRKETRLNFNYSSGVNWERFPDFFDRSWEERAIWEGGRIFWQSWAVVAGQYKFSEDKEDWELEDKYVKMLSFQVRQLGNKA